MHRIINLLILIGFLFLHLPVFASGQMNMSQIFYYHANKGNLSALQKLKQMGYSVDISDRYGNSAICNSIYKKDYSAFALLKQVGANVSHPCVKRIPSSTIHQFNQNYANWAQAVNTGKIAYAGATTQTTAVATVGAATTATVATTTGLSAAAMVGIGVGTAALIGGGIALAAGGGGGGGSRIDSSNKVDSSEKDSVVCNGHGTLNAEGVCQCKEGYEGDDCSSLATCPDYSQSCTTGYHEKVGDTCQSGTTTLVKCEENDCSDYTLTSCPTNMQCTSCQSGDKTTYKKSSCKTGWTGDDCTTPATCPDYNISCGEGYQQDTTDTCQSGNQVLYKCKAKDCSGYSEDCGEGYNKVEACLSGIKQYYSCVPKSCGDGYVPGTSCGVGYVQEGELCQSGEDTYIKCIEDPCPDYSQSCTVGYHVVSGDTCQSGTTTLVRCEENDCSDYTLTSCSTNMQCTSCQSGDKTTYKKSSCKTGWTGDDCTTPATCPDYNTSCGEGYQQDTTDTCQSGNQVLYKCKAKDCSGYSEDCGEGYNKVEACLSGTKQYYSCVPKSCGDGYVLGTTCGDGYVQEGDLCKSGTDTYIKCVKAPCPDYTQSCPTGYHEKVGDTCQSGTTTLVKCEENDCSDYPLSSCNETYMDCSSCTTPSGPKYKKMNCKTGWTGDDCTTPATCSDYSTSCGEGYQVVSGDTCQSGTSTLVKCIENSCEGYTVGNCPENAEDCRECMRGTTQTYQFTQCKDGWEGETCSEEKPCNDYPLTACPSNAECEGTCRSGNTDKFKITKCTNTDHVPSSDGLSCVLYCAANKYASGDTCLSCPPGATSPENSSSINDCVCGSGYKLEDGICEQVDFVNLEKHPGSSKTAEQITSEPEFSKGNFLSQINAQYAYERGYTGYLANKDLDTGVLNSNTLTTTGVKVGILDSGVDINHPDLVDNVVKDKDGNPYGYNFDYGVCRNGDKTNCYAVKPKEGQTSGDIVFYKTGEDDYEIILEEDYEPDDFDDYFDYYPSNYDWDEWKNNPTPHNTNYKDNEVSEILNTNSNDHGTHIAGIIAATINNTGLQGVAPNAQIVAAVESNTLLKNDINEYRLPTYQAFADEGVRVINKSWGAPATNDKTTWAGYAEGKDASVVEKKMVESYKLMAQKSIVSVVAAGNDGNDKEASIDNGIPLTTTFKSGSSYDLTNLFITVVAADKNDKLTSYSQHCGATAGYCLTAPGGDLSRGYELFGSSEAYLNLENAETELQRLQDIYEETGNYENYETYSNYYDNVYQPAYTDYLNAYNAIPSEWGIYSTVQNDSKHDYVTEGDDNVSYGYMQGTSMATPVVTGSVALLMSAYPHLSSQQVVEILFRSANKDLDSWGGTLYNEVEGITLEDQLSTWTDSFGNTYEISKIYGHGMVDLKAATEPLGELKTPTSKSVASKQSLVNTKLALPRVVSSDMNKLLSKKVLGLDDYNRPFATSIEGTIKWAYRNPDAFKRDFKSFMSKNKIQTAGIKDKLSFAFSSAKTDRNLMGLGILDMNYRLNDVSDLKFSYRSDILNETEYLDKALTNPFMNMTDSYSLAQSLKYKDLSFSFGATVGKNAFYETDEDKDEEFERSVHAFDAEIAYRPKRSLMFKVIGGVMQEKEALLGMNGSGIFSTDDGRTYFTGAKIEYKPFVPFTLSASYYYGRSAMPNSKGLVRIDNVISDSFAFDVRYQPDNKNMLGFQFSSPLRIRKGNAVFNLPVARDLYMDEVYFAESKISLKPKSREYDLALYYMTETQNYDWRGELMMRLNPDHMSGVKPDYRALFGLSYKY